MSEPSPEASDQPSPDEGIKRGVRRKVVVSKSSAIGASRSQKRPVVVRNATNNHPISVRISRSSSRKTAPVISNTSQPKISRKPAVRHGKPDFSSSIITDKSLHSSRHRKSASIHQRLFFDAAIAVVTLSFMVLTILHL